MKTILTALMILTISSYSFGQESKEKSPQYLIRTSLLSPLEGESNVMLGLEMVWKRRWSAIVEPGYIFEQNFGSTRVRGARNHIRGLKLRTELRYYFSDLSYSNRRTFFVSSAFHYKKVNSELWEEFGMNCVNGDCDFLQIDTYKRIKREIGGLVMFGGVTPLIRDRFAMEGYIGLGVKVKKFRNEDIPPGASFRFDPFRGFFGTDQDGSHWMVPIGVKFSYRIGGGSLY